MSIAIVVWPALHSLEWTDTVKAGAADATKELIAVRPSARPVAASTKIFFIGCLLQCPGLVVK
jgi:hypothetical protein